MSSSYDRPAVITERGRRLRYIPERTAEPEMREHHASRAEQQVKEGDAACRRANPDLFFPISNGTPMERRQIELAKGYCRQCPVLEPCRQFAFEALPYGVAGGLDEWERRDMRRRGITR